MNQVAYLTSSSLESIKTNQDWLQPLATAAGTARLQWNQRALTCVRVMFRDHLVPGRFHVSRHELGSD